MVSESALRAAPFGPVDGLDTRHGRAAQVRLVFVTDRWPEEELADAVDRWRRLGCAEVCGILDFGRHEDRWYLALPPSLGMSVERWRATRQPGPAAAARLTLAFGRLVERISAAGFPVDSADLSDFAVGPGPTPFLERPLLGSPPGDGLEPREQDGQRTLAMLLAAAVPAAQAGALTGWLSAASEATFPGLAACLDDLERCGNAAREDERSAGNDGLGLDSLFDEDEEDLLRRVVAPSPSPWRRVLAAASLLAVIGAVAALAFTHGAHGASPHAPPATGVPQPVTAVTAPHPPVAHPKPRPRPKPARRRPVRHHTVVRHARPKPPAATQTTTSVRTVTPPPAPPPVTPPSHPTSTGLPNPAGGGGGLPDPGKITALPPP
jgi:hypothetical protein